MQLPTRGVIHTNVVRYRLGKCGGTSSATERDYPVDPGPAALGMRLRERRAPYGPLEPCNGSELGTQMRTAALSDAKCCDALRSLACFKNVHRGETILVCGCGESLDEFIDALIAEDRAARLSEMP